MKFIIRTFLTAAVVLTSVANTPVQAQFAKPEQAIKYRKSVFNIMGTHFGRVGAMVQGKVPFDAKIAAENIAAVNAVTKLPWPAFIEGTDKGDAKSKIWTEKVAFDEKAQDMQKAVAALHETTKSGNFTLDQLKTAFAAAGKTCGSCHDAYKNK